MRHKEITYTYSIDYMIDEEYYCGLPMICTRCIDNHRELLHRAANAAGKVHGINAADVEIHKIMGTKTINYTTPLYVHGEKEN